MRLIFIVGSVISGFVAISLVFFQATRETYPGFGRWTAGVGFLTLGYLAFGLRGFIPDALSIFLVTVAFPLGMVFLLDGLRRFLGLTPMSRICTPFREWTWWQQPFFIICTTWPIGVPWLPQ